MIQINITSDPIGVILDSGFHTLLVIDLHLLPVRFNPPKAMLLFKREDSHAKKHRLSNVYV